MQIYTIRDLVAGYFMSPFYARTNAEAIRTLTQAVNDTRDTNNKFASHPADYALYLIGSFDDNTGEIKPIAVEKLGIGIDFVKPSNNQ